MGKCGNPGDPNFQYTWGDGARLCKVKKQPNKPNKPNKPNVPSGSKTCEKCGMWAGSDKASCCAAGGSWFGTCGAVSNGFKRTWAEGVKACKGVTGISSGQDGSHGNMTQDLNSVQKPKSSAATNGYHVLLHGIIITVFAV